MGGVGAADRRDAAASGRTWEALAQQSGSAQWHLVDSTHWSALERNGPICRSATHRTRRATAGSSIGSVRAPSSTSSRRWPGICKNVAALIAPNAVLTAPLWWRKRGRMCGKDQAGQRFEAHGQTGLGRPFWSSSRRLRRLSCVSRGHARRPNSRLPLCRRAAGPLDWRSCL